MLFDFTAPNKRFGKYIFSKNVFSKAAAWLDEPRHNQKPLEFTGQMSLNGGNNSSAVQEIEYSGLLSGSNNNNRLTDNRGI